MHHFGFTLQIRRQINHRLGNELFFNKILYTGYCSKKLSSTDVKLDHIAVDKSKTVKNPSFNNVIDSASQKLQRKGEINASKNVRHCFLYIPGSGAVGTSKCLFLKTSKGSYLFNCGEDTARTSHFTGASGKEVKNIFISQLVWQNIGGLGGTMKGLLNIQEMQEQANPKFKADGPVFALYGPPGLKQLFEVMKCLIDLRHYEIKIVDTVRDQLFEDHVLKINCVPLYPSELSSNDAVFTETATKKKPKLDIDSMIDAFLCYNYHGFPQKKDYKERMKLNDVKFLMETNERTRRASICYVCRAKLEQENVRLNLETCVDLGVPPSLLGKLKKKEDITLPDGKIVRFQDVSFSASTDKTFMVIDCPGEEYLDSLLDQPIFKKLQTTTLEEEKPVVIVHFSPPSVMNNPKYQSWMANFPVTTKHIRVNEENFCTGNNLNHQVQTKLNLIHDEIFPLLPNPAIPIIPMPESLKKKKQNPYFYKIEKKLHDLGAKINWKQLQNLDEKLLVGGSKIVIDLKNATIGNNPAFTICPEGYVHDALLEEGAKETLKNLKIELREMEAIIKSRTGGDYPKILFLGTGSSCPQNTRNVSGILVSTTEDTCMLMDCGGGTFNRLVTFYGKEKADEVLLKLKAIYISHMHADHHLGLIEVIKGRRRAIKDLLERTRENPDFKNLSNAEIISKLNIKPLYLIGPYRLMEWLNFYNNFFEKINDDFNFIFIGTFQYLKRKEGSPVINVAYTKDNIRKTSPEGTVISFLQDLHIKELETCLVHHCFSSFGLTFTTKNDFKISYSGDCTPSRYFMTMGRDSDLLIHEATFENYLSNLARTKKHSTISEAIFVGQKMRAKYILLTHFSQRYSYLPMNTETFPNNVGIAFDFMTVSMKQLPLLPRFLPAIRMIFADELRKMANKTMLMKLKDTQEQIEFFEKLKS